MSYVDVKKIIPVSDMVGEDDEETSELNSMLVEAENYIMSYTWCNGILEKYFGMGVGGVFCVFLFHIKPKQKEIDEYLWIIVGDLPPLYIVTDNAPNPACALDIYIGIMSKWVDAAIRGNDVSGLAPITVEPTPLNGHALKKRLEYLDKEILSHHKDDLL